MNSYKVCVYAICKNEEKFVDRWINSMKEADEIIVLDTGSTDKTVEKLNKYEHVTVKTKVIEPWRFDMARNESLKLVPEDCDICVCTDLDEVFIKGWRKELEKVWKKDTNRCRYIYNWNLDNNNNPTISFYYEKIHSRNNYKWIHPVHEILKYDGKEEENYVITNNIILNHYPDATKSRSNYLSLLELSVKEEPTNDRNMHYLGREYMYHKEWKKSIKTLKKHLNLESATWKDERCASMRFISRCYQNLNDFSSAREWLLKAIKEAPYLRDPYMEMALLEYNQKNYKEVEKYCLKALRIKSHEKTYINEIFSWDNTVYDLLSISCYYLEKIDYAIYFIDKALEYTPNDKRLLENKKLFLEKEV